MDGWMDGWIDGWMNGWIDVVNSEDVYSSKMVILSNVQSEHTASHDTSTQKQTHAPTYARTTH